MKESNEMAYTTTHPTAAPLVRGVVAVYEKAANAMYRRRMYRETFSGLSALSDRDLSDLGLHRGELRAVARKASTNLR